MRRAVRGRRAVAARRPVRGRRAASAIVAATALLTLTGGAARAHAKLTFERPDGTQIPFTGTPRVYCGPWDDRAKQPSIHVRLQNGKTRGWLLSAVRRDIVAGRRLRFPNSFVFDRPRRADLFVYDAPNEASTQGEDSSGSITFTRVACTRGRVVAFRIDATVDSEFIDGDLIRVSGSFRGRVTKAP